MDTNFQPNSVFMQLYAKDFCDRAVEAQAGYDNLPPERVLKKMADKIAKSAPIAHSRAEEAYLQDTALLMAYQNKSASSSPSQ
jgi:hypothetical protein